jgi:hypothetical protein
LANGAPRTRALASLLTLALRALELGYERAEADLNPRPPEPHEWSSVSWRVNFYITTAYGHWAPGLV